MAYCTEDAELPTQVLQLLKIRLPGAGEDAIKAELHMTCLDFFTRSKIWRTEVLTGLYEGVTDYQISAPQNGSPLGIFQVEADGTPLAPVSGDYNRDHTNISAPHFVCSDDLLELTLSPTPITTASQGLRIVYHMGPPNGGLNPLIPPSFAFRYQEALVDGVLASMSGHPARPYTSPSMIGYYRQRYNSGVARARRDALSRFSRVDTGWRFPRLAPGSGSGRASGGFTQRGV